MIRNCTRNGEEGFAPMKFRHSVPYPELKIASWDFGRHQMLPMWTEFILFQYCNDPDWFYSHENTSKLGIEIPVSGNLYLRLDEDEFLLSPGQAFVIPTGKNDMLRMGPDGFFKKISFGFSGMMLADFLSETQLDTRKQIPLLPERFRKIEKILEELFGIMERKDPDTATHAAGLSLELLLEIERSTRPVYPTVLGDAVYILQSQLSRDYKISELETFLKISKYKLNALFMEYFHKTPKQYFKAMKMKNAAAYLLSSTFPIKEISLKTGYRDQLVFSREFKKYYGDSPAEYRKKNSGR